MDNIVAPTLLLDENICRANIRKMADKASQNGLTFKPHMKTHQSAQIGGWMAESGVKAITVSSVKMAHYFARNGWDDITIAFPCNIRQAPAIDELAQNVSLTLLINKIDTAKQLDRKLTTAVDTYIEIDTGSGRTGLAAENIAEIKNLINAIDDTKHISWIGFYSHAGHSYGCRGAKEINRVHQKVMQQFKGLRKTLEPEYGSFEICSGDTPCCAVADNFEAVDAISPGNFVFYDLMQSQIGSCSEHQIAVAMACPVVDKYPERQELVIHGGAVHFSKEFMTQNDNTHFGLVAERINGHWQISDQQSHLNKLSQEHGTIRCTDKTIEKYDVGDIITILPVHSCLTANLMNQYRLLTDGTVIKQM